MKQQGGVACGRVSACVWQLCMCVLRVSVCVCVARVLTSGRAAVPATNSNRAKQMNCISMELTSLTLLVGWPTDAHCSGCGLFKRSPAARLDHFAN